MIFYSISGKKNLDVKYKKVANFTQKRVLVSKVFFFLSQHSKKETRENVIDHLSNMQSSIALAGVQWNMPVESYFISVFSKSKSLAWSSAMPTSKPFPPPFAFSTLALFVGLKQN